MGSSVMEHDMDHDMDDGMDMDNCTMTMEMAMYFFFSKKATVLFKDWNFSTGGALVLSMIAIFAMAAIYEALKYLREHVYRKYTLTDKNTTTPSPPTVQPTMLSPTHFLQTFLYLLQMIISYFLMLIFMTYNGWLCMAVVLGAGFGYFLFGWKKQVIVDATEHCN
ncbi:hypothetical protein JTB14_025438 [Gonioctena quinquepunctata]|nr:hypothetical protein JTB14_025438 [Gonioctena quinquepunctata]